MKKIYSITLIALFSALSLSGQWNSTNLDQQIYDMTEHGGSLYASANDQGLVKYNGTTWDSIGTNDFSVNPVGIHIVELASSGSNLYAVVQNQVCADAMVYKSTDGGVTYQADTAGLPRIGSWAGPCAGKISSLADLYAMDGHLIATFNGGAYLKKPADAAWSPLVGNVKFAEAWGNYQGKWYAYYSNNVYVSSDFGQTWTTPLNAGKPTFYTSTHMIVNPTSGRIWITGAASIFDGPGLYYSDDFAATWDSVSIKKYLGTAALGSKQHILDMFSIGDTLLLSVANDASNTQPDMLISYDNGATFSSDTAGLHSDQYGTAASTAMVHFNNDLFLAFNFQGVYRKGASTVGINEGASNTVLWTPYPNPVTNTINIKGLDGKATLSLISANGSKIRVINNNNSVDMSNCTPGIYFLQITLGDRTEYHKLIKQ